jgi:hypothetical protein
MAEHLDGNGSEKKAFPGRSPPPARVRLNSGHRRKSLLMEAELSRFT